MSPAAIGRFYHSAGLMSDREPCKHGQLNMGYSNPLAFDLSLARQRRRAVYNEEAILYLELLKINVLLESILSKIQSAAKCEYSTSLGTGISVSF